MKLLRALKTYCLFALAICASSALFMMSNSTQLVNAAENPVELYYTYENPEYIFEKITIYIKTNNSGNNENVTIHGDSSGTNEEWVDYKANYVETLQDGSKIWKAEISYPGGNFQYAIKYEVNGQTYWDNNYGKNYTNKNILGTAVIGVHPAGSGYDPSNYPIRVNVKNLGYDKKINVRYTENDWKDNNFKDVPLTYIATNEDGSELWGTTLKLNEITTDKFHYAVSYEQNGTVYWDNNFEANYNY
ncbi:carbohydrate-binding protein [uncultured Clostridium sp.]|uniref:carbohydrate-binding protein n=1 Tax=uncultured Clostridium sp. TaxID=59620 RepID=UPI0028EDC43E|nr:carbohydrate-binding protein [uncultured Clostridium sp.]